MTETMTVYDYLHERPELVDDGLLEELRAFRRISKRKRRKGDNVQKLIHLADRIGVSKEASCRRNFYILEQWLLSGFCIALERAIAAKKLKLRVGKKIYYAGIPHVVERVNKDFSVRLKAGFSVSAIALRRTP